MHSGTSAECIVPQVHFVISLKYVVERRQGTMLDQELSVISPYKYKDKLVCRSNFVAETLYENQWSAGSAGRTPGLGRFDFQKFSLIFAPGVSIILFCI